MAWILTAVIGILGGIASGLFGVGGGAVFVPLLVFFRSFDTHLAIGTSLAVVLPTAMMGVFHHGSAKMVDWKTVFIMACFAMIGAWLGSWLSLKMSTLLLKRLFALFLMAIAFKLFFSN